MIWESSGTWCLTESLDSAGKPSGNNFLSLGKKSRHFLGDYQENYFETIKERGDRNSLVIGGSVNSQILQLKYYTRTASQCSYQHASTEMLTLIPLPWKRY